MSGNVFNFDVDTTPMGESLLHISHNVESTTGAVVQSTAVLVAAEEEGSRLVSQNISAGFFSLIRSQLEQKKASAKSSIDAKSAQLVGEKKAGETMEIQFIGDFNRIKNRYSKLFTSLNKALKLRISEIDKPVFQIVEKDYRQAMRKRLFSVGGSVVSGFEGGRANATLRSGQTKGQVLRLLDAMKNYLVKTQRLNLQIASILGVDRTEKATEVSLPFLVAEMDTSFEGQRAWTLKVPSGSEAYGFHAGLDSGVNAMDLGQTVWEAPDRELRDRVNQRFFEQIDQAGLDERVRSQMKELFDASAWTTMKGTAG
jgi:hypothetical protein